MPFQFTDAHIVEHRTLGYTVFRQILPASLVADLRRAVAPAHRIARHSNPRAMRLTGVARHGLDGPAFRDFAELPALRDAVARVLTPEHVFGNRDGMAILIETLDIPVCQAWHRDLRIADAGPEHLAELRLAQFDPLVFNQINCPLYEDHCLWFVPGSHLRVDDFPAEAEAIRSKVLVEPQGVTFSNEDREQLGLIYCRAMPGGVCLGMDAGDFALYNPLALHLGNVIPYKPRATIHDAPISPASNALRLKLNEWVKARAQANK